jgi:putative spermidine/putrescine transport system substrate-binding protein
MNKKTLLSAVVAATLALGAGSALAQTRTLVLSTFGFNGALLKKHVFDPFEAQCGCKIVLETGNAAERVTKLEARRNNPNVDVIQVGDFLAQEASAKGLLQPIDPARLKNLDQVYDFGRDPLGNKEAIAYTVYSIGLVVRTDKPSAQVASWKDLWRPDLKGHLMLANITGQQGMAQLFMADRAWGGPGTGDMAAGMKKIGELKDNVVTYYAQTAQMTAMFAQDEAWVAPVGRFSWSNLVKTGKPLKWVRGPGRGAEHDVHRQGHEER